MKSLNKRIEKLMSQYTNPMNKKGQVAGISQNFNGIIALVFSIVVGFVGVALLLGANLLESGSDFDNTTDYMVGNLTDGVNQVSAKIPTIFTVLVAVLLLGLITFLAIRARQVQQAQGQSL